MIQILGLIEVVLPVQNMERMIGFYRDVLGLTVHYPQNVLHYRGEHTVVLNAGACRIVLKSGGQSHPCTETSIVFGVQDIEHARSYLIQRDVVMGEVHFIEPGIMFCSGHDPEGNAFCLRYQQLITDVPTQPLP